MIDFDARLLSRRRILGMSHHSTHGCEVWKALDLSRGMTHMSGSRVISFDHEMNRRTTLNLYQTIILVGTSDRSSRLHDNRGHHDLNDHKCGLIQYRPQVEYANFPKATR